MNPLPDYIWIISFRKGADFYSYDGIILLMSNILLTCSWIGNLILISYWIVPITFLFKNIGADVFITGAILSLLFKYNDFNGIYIWPIFVCLFPYDAHISTLNVYLFKYLKKKSSYNILNVN